MASNNNQNQGRGNGKGNGGNQKGNNNNNNNNNLPAASAAAPAMSSLDAAQAALSSLVSTPAARTASEFVFASEKEIKESSLMTELVKKIMNLRATKGDIAVFTYQGFMPYQMIQRLYATFQGWKDAELLNLCAEGLSVGQIVGLEATTDDEKAKIIAVRQNTTVNETEFLRQLTRMAAFVAMRNGVFRNPKGFSAEAKSLIAYWVNTFGIQLGATQDIRPYTPTFQRIGQILAGPAVRAVKENKSQKDAPVKYIRYLRMNGTTFEYVEDCLPYFCQNNFFYTLLLHEDQDLYESMIEWGLANDQIINVKTQRFSTRDQIKGIIDAAMNGSIYSDAEKKAIKGFLGYENRFYQPSSRKETGDITKTYAYKAMSSNITYLLNKSRDSLEQSLGSELIKALKDHNVIGFDANGYAIAGSVTMQAVSVVSASK